MSYRSLYRSVASGRKQELPGRVLNPRLLSHIQGTEQEGRGTQEVPVPLGVFKLMLSTSQMLCKVHTQAGTRPKLLMQSMYPWVNLNVSYYCPSLSYFEFVSNRCFDVANTFSNCRLQNTGIIWEQVSLTGTKEQLKSQCIKSTKSWSKSCWKLTIFKCHFLGLSLTEKRKLKPSKPAWRVLANQFCYFMKRSGRSCGACVYPKLLRLEKVGPSLAELHIVGGIMQHDDSTIYVLINVSNNR